MFRSVKPSRLTVHRTVRFYGSSLSRYKNNPNPQMWFGLFFFGASVLIGLFENISNTNCFLNFRASNFLVFTSQNAPIISRIPTLTFFHRLITLAASEHFPSLSGCKCSRSFLYQNGWKFSVSSPRGRRTESRPYPFTLGNFRGFRY